MLGVFLSGFVLGMFALAVVVVLTINVKTRGRASAFSRYVRLVR